MPWQFGTTSYPVRWKKSNAHASLHRYIAASRSLDGEFAVSELATGTI
jgi:hypothetical protein